MIGGRRRFAAHAVTREVGGNHGEVFGQNWRNGMPHHMGLRIAMQ